MSHSKNALNQVNRVIGVPVKLLHESVGFVCTVELRNGEVYRGLVVDTEDTWNLQMQSCVLTDREGKVSSLDYVYLRGSHIRFVIVPDMLKNSPMFLRFTPRDKAKLTGNLAKTPKARK